MRLELTIPSSGITAFQERLLIRPDAFLIVVPQGLEPRFYGPKPHVLPLDEGTINGTNMSKNIVLRSLSGSN